MNRNDYAMLQLAAAKPLADLPPFHLAIAERLAIMGLLSCDDGRWYPTAAGLGLIRATVH